MPNLKRRVEFWRIRAYRNKVRQDIAPLLSAIGALPRAPGARYQEWSDDAYLSMEVSNHAAPYTGALGTTRMKGLPLIDNFGQRRGLQLATDEGLYEPSHFVLFDDQLLGVEYNYYGPRPRSLQNYMRKALPQAVDNVEMVPLINPTIHDQLARLGSISLLNLSVRRDARARLRGVDSHLFSALNALDRASEAPYLTIGLEIAPHGRNGFSPGIARRLSRLLARRDTNRADFKRAIIRGKDASTDETVELDLLNQFVMAKKSVVKEDENLRSVNPASMFTAIVEARNELDGEIRGALERIG